MDEAARLAETGEPAGTVVVAEEQTAGRGRAGRSWHAPRGTAILCSVLLRPSVPPDRLAVLPLVVGVGAAEAIEGVSGLPCRLKWPNDVWLGRDLKVAGILLTARSGPAGVDYAIVGIGINVNVPLHSLPPGATSLLAEAGRPFDREFVLERLLERLDDEYWCFLTAGAARAIGGWRQRAALLHEPVTVTVGGHERAGIMRGVAEDGALLLERRDGTVERIVAGDLVRGPVPTGL